MSQATKVVLGTVLLSAVCPLALPLAPASANAPPAAAASRIASRREMLWVILLVS